VAEVREKALAPDLAVVHDIEPHGNLARYDLPSGRMGQLVEYDWVQLLPTSAGGVRCGELARPGQAAGMSGQDAGVAPFHRDWIRARLGEGRSLTRCAEAASPFENGEDRSTVWHDV
jgi:hypothetical protein